jgi:class 3 adenylate cyclase/tetratricopeptide (TPR) repeat protein
MFSSRYRTQEVVGSSPASSIRREPSVRAAAWQCPPERARLVAVTTAEPALDRPSRCPACGETNPARSRFCSSCGTRLEDAGAVREERKLVSVLFVDLVGFTARSDRADPEDVRDVLHLYHAEAKERIEHHGGVVEKFIGDAVMAVFGAPVAHGDDAERAVRAGLRVLVGIGELNREHALDLAARAAVNTGDAVVSVDAARADALATGDVVNTASRLQSAAPPGRLLVGGETYRATRHAIRYEAVETVEAKGKAERLEAWVAVEPLLAPAERPLAVSRIVGRSHELALMSSVWTRCLTELRPHLVTVLGPPGIGKSRLCHELSVLVSSGGGRILRGRCLPYEEQAGYQGFSRLVHAAAGILESDSPAVAREKLKLAIAELMPEAETPETFRYLALLLGLAPDDDVPEVGQQLLFFAARRFIECVGLSQPTVFVFEDIHWAQSSEIALLEYLAQHLRDSPVMLIAAARPELLDARPTWGSGLAPQTTIPLDPLRPEEAEALAVQVAEAAGARDFDVKRMVEVAGGNPLFLEELAASVAEAGEGQDLPVTVREAIAARMDALPQNARAALLSAAVIGKTFWRDLLQEIASIEDVDDALGVLEARDLVRHDSSSQLSGDIQFTFKHILIREVAYSTLPRAVRRELHAAVARHVEERFAGAGETLPAILAYHWREAGEPARAIPYLLAAADAARRSWAQGAVVDLYSKAIELADHDDLRRRIRLQRGFALVELADYPRAVEELTELLPELEGQERLDTLIALGHAQLWAEQDEETLATAAEAASLLDEVDDQSATPAVLAMKSQALAMRGAGDDVSRALELGDRALELWVPGTRPEDLREHLHMHANLTYWVGQYERSGELSMETRALAADVHSAESLLRGGGLQALAFAGLGRHEEAIAIWEDLIQLARELGRNPRVVLNYSTLAYRELYDLAEARRRSEEVLELSAAETFGMPRQFAGSDLLFTELLAGDIGSAQTTWPSLWDGAEQATAWTTWLIAGRLLCARAEIAFHAEAPESAVEWAERAIEVTRQTRRRKYEARSLTLLGQALARLGRREEAVGALQSAVEIADDLVGAPARWQARAALGEASYALGDDETAAAAYDQAASLVQSFAAALAPERKARLLAAPPIDEILSLGGRRPAA